METINLFFDNHIDWYLLALIILSGIFITKYTSDIKIGNTYKVLISSLLISVILYFITDCKNECITKYLFTYFFATSFYELIVRFVLNKTKDLFKKQ